MRTRKIKYKNNQFICENRLLFPNSFVKANLLSKGDGSSMEVSDKLYQEMLNDKNNKQSSTPSSGVR